MKTEPPVAKPAGVPTKPLGIKAYGHIPHLPGSRLGPGDYRLNDGQARICCEKTRDKFDVVAVQEKLDGSNVAVVKLHGEIIPLIRAGYRAVASDYEQHRHFHNWVYRNLPRFEALLEEGERCVGEWLMQAHGTRYELKHEPFVVFDFMRVQKRTLTKTVQERCRAHSFATPRLIHFGGAISIERVLKLLEPSGHGALNPVEGAVWRVERDGTVEFLAKYVRPEKKDGTYLPEASGQKAVWNWYPPEE